MTSISLCHELRQHVRHEYEHCDVFVIRSDDNVLDDCFQVSQRLTSDPRPLHNCATGRLTEVRFVEKARAKGTGGKGEHASRRGQFR